MTNLCQRFLVSRTFPIQWGYFVVYCTVAWLEMMIKTSKNYHLQFSINFNIFVFSQDRNETKWNEMIEERKTSKLLLILIALLWQCGCLFLSPFSMFLIIVISNAFAFSSVKYERKWVIECEKCRDMKNMIRERKFLFSFMLFRLFSQEGNCEEWNWNKLWRN